MSFPRFAAVLLFALPVSAPVVVAANDMQQAREIELLKQQLKDLQLRVERLEKGRDQEFSFSKEPEAEPIDGGWRKAHNWNLLKEGMTSYQVKAILGEPERQKTVKKFEFWYYGDAKVSVYLRRLKGWEIPSGIETE
jgi:hypothetical protein